MKLTASKAISKNQGAEALSFTTRKSYLQPRRDDRGGEQKEKILSSGENVSVIKDV